MGCSALSKKKQGKGKIAIFTALLFAIQLLMPYSCIAEDINHPTSSRKFKVGYILPLSGHVGSMGEAFKRGVILYQREHKSFQRNVVISFEDHRYDGKTAITALHKLRDADGIDVAVVWGVTPSASCMPVAESLHLPLIAVTLDHKVKSGKYVITFGPKVERLMEVDRDYLIKWGIKRPATVTIDIGSTIKAINILDKYLKGKLLKKIVPAEESDFKTIIVQLKQKNVDGLVLLMGTDQALTFLRQAAQLQFHPRIIGGDFFADDMFQRQVRSLPLKLSYSYGAVKNSFIKKLKKHFGTASYFYEAASGYTITYLLHKLSTKGVTPENFIQKIAEIKLDNIPIVGLKLVKDENSIMHLQNGAFMYEFQTSSSK